MQAETATTRSMLFHRSSATETAARDDKAFLTLPAFPLSKSGFLAVSQRLRQGCPQLAAGQATHRSHISTKIKLLSPQSLFPASLFSPRTRSSAGQLR